MEQIGGTQPIGRESPPAADLLEVAIIKNRRAWLTTVVTLPAVVFTGVVLHPCRLEIRRRSDHAVLLDYKYRSLSAAADHYQYIVGRMSEEPLADFCTEYQIPLDQVA